MAEQPVVQSLCFVSKVIESQERAAEDGVASSNDAEAEFEALERDRASLEADLGESQASRDFLKSRHAALLASIKLAKVQAEAEREEAEAKKWVLTEMEVRRIGMWGETLVEVNKKGRDLLDLVAQLKPEALRSVNDAVSADVVEWSEMRVQAKLHLTRLLKKADAPAPYDTENLRRAFAGLAVPDALSETMEEKRKSIKLLVDVIEELRDLILKMR